MENIKLELNEIDMNFYEKNKGNIKNIPLIIRKLAYILIQKIDFDEVDEILDVSGGCVISKENNGIQVALFKDLIMVLIKMKYYNFDIKKLSDDKILTFNIKRTEIEELCKQ